MYFQNSNPYSGSNAYNVPNPNCPYNDGIPSGLTPGKVITINGHVGHGADRLTFNLLTHSGNIALHINPRLPENVTVRNSLINSGWGNEEKHGPMIFQQGAPYELTIQACPDKYMIHINGHPAFHFAHRVPLQEVARLEIQGQMSVNRISYNNAYQPIGNELANPNVPCSVPFSPQPGRLTQLRIVPQPGRFVINLQNGTAAEGSNDIQFHVSIRWDDPSSGGRPVVIRTNCQGGGWGPEERNHQHFPFQQGVEAEVLILLDPYEWKMAVNGQHFVSMAHRSPFQQANYLNINGNVQVRSIRQF